MKRRVFLIHGWGGFPEEGWRPWLKEKLIGKGFEVFNLAMPDTNNPISRKWVDYLKNSIVIPNINDYLIGHSLGAITILRYLETLKKDQGVGGAILVAGFARDLEHAGYKGEISSFFNMKLDWEKIRRACQKFVVIHSDNDPYVPLKHNKILREKLKGKSIIMHNMKHFSGEDGITKLPVIFNELMLLIKD